MVLAKGNRSAAREGRAKEVQSGTGKSFREGVGGTPLCTLPRARLHSALAGVMEPSNLSAQSVSPTIPLREEPFQSNTSHSLMYLSLGGWLLYIAQR